MVYIALLAQDLYIVTDQHFTDQVMQAEIAPNLVSVLSGGGSQDRLDASLLALTFMTQHNELIVNSIIDNQGLQKVIPIIRESHKNFQECVLVLCRNLYAYKPTEQQTFIAEGGVKALFDYIEAMLVEPSKFKIEFLYYIEDLIFDNQQSLNSYLAHCLKDHAILQLLDKIIANSGVSTNVEKEAVTLRDLLF